MHQARVCTEIACSGMTALHNAVTYNRCAYWYACLVKDLASCVAVQDAVCDMWVAAGIVVYRTTINAGGVAAESYMVERWVTAEGIMQPATPLG